MTCVQCRGIIEQFDDKVARRDLRRYRRRGPSASTRRLASAIRGAGLSGATFLDVGGGVGALPHALLAAGARGGTAVDASPAYLEVAREEAEHYGLGDRIRFVEGDFVTLARDLEPADVVTLDRVLCCYDNMPALVDASAARARRLYGLVFPREHLPTRVAVRAINAVQSLRRRAFKVYLHGAVAIDRRVRRNGFRSLWQGNTLLWHIHLYIRDAGAKAV